MRFIGRMACGTMAVLALAACETTVDPGPGDPRVVEIRPAADTLEALQDTVRLSATVRDGQGVELAARVTWSSLDPGVARVDSLGRVVSVDLGTARITATAGGAADTARVTVISGVSPTQLAIVRFRTDARTLATYDTSFWVVNERGREVVIRYSSGGGAGSGDEFLKFKIPGEALLRYPDGRSFARTDSVRVRLQLTDPAAFLFEFSPEGLRFEPERPAELEVQYAEAETGALQLPERLAIWRQEQPGSPWVRLATARIEDARKVRARLTGFTRFALATN